MEVKFYDTVEDKLLKFAVIVANVIQIIRPSFFRNLSIKMVEVYTKIILIIPNTIFI